LEQRPTDDVPDFGSRRLGAGDFPPELDRVNWGAVLLGFFWAIAYRQTTWVIGLALLWAANLGVLGIAVRYGTLAHLAVTALFFAAFTTAGIVLGLRANRLVWAGEHAVAERRTARGLAPAPSIREFLSSQRRWAITGVMLWAFGWGVSLVRPSSALSPLRAVITFSVELAAYGALFAVDRIRAAGRQRS
jgi:hypothetical protein